MSGPVLVAVDPRRVDSISLVWAVDWCLHTADELLVVSAFDPDQAEMAPDWYEAAVAQAHQAVEARLTTLVRRTPVRHRSRLVDGDVRDIVIATAQEEDASLVVVGAQGTGGFHELGLGGVSHHVIHHLQRPVAVVPQTAGPITNGPIVVGVDGSRGSTAALRWAIDTARTLSSPVHAVYASDSQQEVFPTANELTTGEREVRAQVDAVEARGVSVTTTFVDDHPVAALTTIADEHDASLVVVGTRGRGGFKGLLLGRVPAQLPHHGRHAVAIIHDRAPA